MSDKFGNALILLTLARCEEAQAARESARQAAAQDAERSRSKRLDLLFQIKTDMEHHPMATPPNNGDAFRVISWQNAQEVGQALGENFHDLGDKRFAQEVSGNLAARWKACGGHLTEEEANAMAGILYFRMNGDEMRADCLARVFTERNLWEASNFIWKPALVLAIYGTIPLLIVGFIGGSNLATLIALIAWGWILTKAFRLKGKVGGYEEERRKLLQHGDARANYGVRASVAGSGTEGCQKFNALLDNIKGWSETLSLRFVGWPEPIDLGWMDPNPWHKR
jgi:hypothetical protein